jgi:hypothetical protein
MTDTWLVCVATAPNTLLTPPVLHKPGSAVAANVELGVAMMLAETAMVAMNVRASLRMDIFIISCVMVYLFSRSVPTLIG